jgi:amidophosphoribosyltransferase
MCGVVAISSHKGFVNQNLYDALLVLQHRGQDAAGICTNSSNQFYIRKGSGLVRDVFRTRDMRNLPGSMGIGHCRYPTAGSAFSNEESQPLYVNSPYGIVIAHNGNLTNIFQLKKELLKHDRRHLNTSSDSEVLLNILANELSKNTENSELNTTAFFKSFKSLSKRIKGGYSVVGMISGFGVFAFRDPWGIRPLILGSKKGNGLEEFIISSESVAIDSIGYEVLRDVAPGECIFIDSTNTLHTNLNAINKNRAPNPCIFEYVYFSRPDSVIDGVSVYEARLKMGKFLAKKIQEKIKKTDIDVIIPIPDSSRPSAVELAIALNLPYREGFIKNRYIGRTFIMPGQEIRKKSVRQKLNPIPLEFKNKNVLLIDDSIVRGTTSKEIIQMARDSGAKKVYFASASPPIRYPNVYGIDMPSASELIAHNKNNDQIAKEIGADMVIYQSLNDLIKACSITTNGQSGPEKFEISCFTGEYLTKDIDSNYLEYVNSIRKNSQSDEDYDANQLSLGLSASD